CRPLPYQPGWRPAWWCPGRPPSRYRRPPVRARTPRPTRGSLCSSLQTSFVGCGAMIGRRTLTRRESPGGTAMRTLVQSGGSPDLDRATPSVAAPDPGQSHGRPCRTELIDGRRTDPPEARLAGRAGPRTAGLAGTGVAGLCGRGVAGRAAVPCVAARPAGGTTALAAAPGRHLVRLRAGFCGSGVGAAAGGVGGVYRARPALRGPAGGTGAGGCAGAGAAGRVPAVQRAEAGAAAARIGEPDRGGGLGWTGAVPAG